MIGVAGGASLDVAALTLRTDRALRLAMGSARSSGCERKLSQPKCPSALVANEAAIGQGATTLRKRPALNGTINVGVPATPQ